jgi:superfamily II DNA/RNA helicase
LSFSEFSSSSAAILVCRRGHQRSAPIQSASIPVVRAGRDLIATVTCSEKTAAFLLAILLDRLHRNHGPGIAALVLAPVCELALQIARKFQLVAISPGVLAALIVGNESMDRQIRSVTNRSGSRCRA